MYLSRVYIGQCKVLLELYLGSVPSASDLVYAGVWPALVAVYGHEWPCGHMNVAVGVHPPWMDGCEPLYIGEGSLGCKLGSGHG